MQRYQLSDRRFTPLELDLALLELPPVQLGLLGRARHAVSVDPPPCAVHADRPASFGTPLASGPATGGGKLSVRGTASVFDAMQPYRDRRAAGRRLAALLAAFRGRDDVLVLAVPRGGVPVAYEIARALQAPLDVVVVRKLGVPFQPELAMGAIASGGIRVLNSEVADELGFPDSVIEAVASHELKELERRERAYRGDRPALDPAGKIAIVVDDGLATGSSMRAAVASLRKRAAAAVVVAVPVGAESTCRQLAKLADDVVCPLQPPTFMAVGQWYEDFDQTSDDEVRRLLDQANPGRPVDSP